MNEFISIVVPAFNEEKAIGEDLDTILAAMKNSNYQYEVIVIDDGSTDKTAEIAREKGVKVIRYPYNKGVGEARKTGIREAKGNIIVMTDADNSYPNREIPQLLKHMDEYDMVIGARKTEKGSLKWLRSPIKAMINRLASYIVRRPIPDLNSGFRAFRKDIALKYFNILPAGHSWVSTITIAFLSHNHTVKYIPIDYYPRKGKSTFHPIRDTYSYILLLVTTIMYFRPLKVFSPLSLLLLFYGVIKIAQDSLKTGHLRVREGALMIVLTGFIIGTVGLLADMMVKMHREKD